MISARGILTQEDAAISLGEGSLEPETGPLDNIQTCDSYAQQPMRDVKLPSPVGVKHPVPESGSLDCGLDASVTDDSVPRGLDFSQPSNVVAGPFTSVAGVSQVDDALLVDTWLLGALPGPHELEFPSKQLLWIVMEIAGIFAGGFAMFNLSLDADEKLIRWDAECCIGSIYVESGAVLSELHFEACDCWLSLLKVGHGPVLKVCCVVAAIFSVLHCSNMTLLGVVPTADGMVSLACLEEYRLELVDL
ncbi:hypothetical protein Nepgr_005327 [Nepenthes gracilis]|uniref:Uncharacterized protein n=1 Tax=Nepenthes gracilis TaxID=150966 RepID=A0AAD3S329_NEPGR|nr:hypothetical protein Nepgr_005327 [Nepenthes gracilis]